MRKIAALVCFVAVLMWAQHQAFAFAECAAPENKVPSRAERVDVIDPAPPRGVPHYIDSLSKASGLDNEGEQLQRPDSNQRAGKDRGPPIGRRFFFCLVGLLLGYLLGVRGLTLFDRGRRGAGIILTGVGFSLASGGFGLWWATGIPATWGWPL